MYSTSRGEPSVSRKSSSLLDSDDSPELKRKSSIGSNESEPEAKKKKCVVTDNDSVTEFKTKSQHSVSDLAKKPSIVRSISGAIPLSKLSTQGLMSLSEARVLLSRHQTTTRIVGVTEGGLQKTLPIVTSKVSKPATVIRKSTSVKTVKRTGLSKRVKTGRKSSSIKEVATELPKRKPIPKKIFEPDEAIMPKKTTKPKIKTESEESKPNRALLYLRGEFVALRADEGLSLYPKYLLLLFVYILDTSEMF